MRTIYIYLLKRVTIAMVASVTVLTFVLVMLNAFQRLFELLVNYDVPLSTVFSMLMLLVPSVVTWTLPWGLLIAVLIVFGRFSHDNELLALNAAGIGLAPIVAPVILLSLFVTLGCLYINASLAPSCMTQFKMMVVDMGRDNPTAFLKTGVPITRFKGYTLFIGKKTENVVENIFIWELGDNGVPTRSVRAERGIITADLINMNLTITLTNARVEERGKDNTKVSNIHPGLKAGQLPLTVSLADALDTSSIEENLSINTLSRLGTRLMGTRTDANLTPVLTEMQKRMAFSFAAFTFVLIGIPLALQFRRKETSIGFILSLVVGLTYYLVVILALAFKDKPYAWPELIIWAPNFAFQLFGFALLIHANYRKY